MKHPSPARCVRGFTMVETIFALLILTMGMGAAISGYLFVLRGERQNSIQAELDIDVRTSMEWLKTHLRTTSLDECVFYPEGPGPYTAISFPQARDDDGDGLIELDERDKIVWDRTIVYHVYDDTPNQLRVTIFDPRDTELTPQQRQDQLDDVVATGNGESTYNGANATTMVLFENLFEWELQGKGVRFDAYRPVLDRNVNAILGSLALDAGPHEFEFTVVGKNPASSGYKLGLDTLVVSAGGAEREAEAQLPAKSQSGGVPVAEYVEEGSWSGNYQLLLDGGEGAQVVLEMDNDVYEDTNFRGFGSDSDSVLVEFDEYLSPKDFVVRLEGQDYTWMAANQTGDNLNAAGLSDLSGNSSIDPNELQGCAVRVLIRGEEMLDGGCIGADAGNVYIYFSASANGALNIAGAYIAELASQDSYTPDTAALGTALDFSWYGGNSTVNIYPGGYALAQVPAGFAIDKSKTYAVTYLVKNAVNSGCPRFWIDHSSTAVNCYIIPASQTPSVATARSQAWSGLGPLSSKTLYGVYGILGTYAPTGTYTSAIIDTHLETPAYDKLDWHSIVPSGCGLTMKVRCGNNEDLSDAPDWDTVSPMGNPGAVNLAYKRYAQFQATLVSNSKPTWWNSYTPKLKDASLSWEGVQRAVDIGGTITTGPDYGIFELAVDGHSLIKGVTVDLEIYQLATGFGGRQQRLTSSMSLEVEPRNTGK